MYTSPPHLAPTSREELSERKDFVESELACLVASKVFYHLGSFEDSLNFALGAGPQFNVNGTSEYNETIICKLVDCMCVEITQRPSLAL